MDVSLPVSETEPNREAEHAMTTPSFAGDKALPKRNSTARTLIPMSWIGRTVVVERLDHTGRVDSRRGKLLDICVLGLVMASAGGEGRCVIPWERVGLLELAA